MAGIAEDSWFGSPKQTFSIKQIILKRNAIELGQTRKLDQRWVRRCVALRRRSRELVIDAVHPRGPPVTGDRPLCSFTLRVNERA